jgi:hypothetical protein
VATVWLYKKYNSTTAYAIGEYCEFNGFIYEATWTVTNQSPLTHPGYWTLIGAVKYLRTKADFFSSINFIVYVPVAVTFDVNQMKALINYYKQAGTNYLITTY